MSEILDIAAALSRLLKAENVLLICHKNPDGDTIGSAAALYWALKGLGKTVAVLCADPIPSRYDYMDIGLYTGQFTPGYTVAVDVAGIQLFGDSIAEYTRRIDMCIDHHPSNSGYADCMLLDGDAAATAEIIYELLTAIGTEITPTIADCLYTGLSTAKVHVSKMGEENATAEAVGALNRAAGHVRSEIAKRMHIRKAPEFRFVADDGAKYAAHINELIAGLEREER